MKTVKQKMFALTENVMANSWSRFQIKDRGNRCYSSLDVSMPTNDPPQEKHNQLSTWETHYYKSCFLSHTHTHTHAYKGEESWCHVVGEWVMKTGFLLAQQTIATAALIKTLTAVPAGRKNSYWKNCMCVFVYIMCAKCLCPQKARCFLLFSVFTATQKYFQRA